MKRREHNDGAELIIGDREYATWQVPNGRGGTIWRAVSCSISGDGAPSEIRSAGTVGEVITLFPDDISDQFAKHYLRCKS